MKFTDYTNSRIRETIREYIHSERDRRMLERRLIDGICYDVLALEFEMSERQIKNIVYKGEAILMKHLPG